MITYFQQHHADILALQEVHNNSKHGWHFEQLKKALNLHNAFGKNVSVADGGYGNAIFSRFPILQWDNISLPSHREQRGLLSTMIDIDGHPIQVWNAHLSLHKSTRITQMKTLEQLTLKETKPCFLMGDFNTTTPSPLSNLVDVGKKAGKSHLPTLFPLRRRIDYIFSSPSFECVEYQVIRLSYSDHYLLKAVFQKSF
jgi:endonuclease/exonuclease/phosphatase family metal-dependent hydrolase